MQSERSLFNPLDLDVSRSTFHNSPTRSGTCMAGRLIPAWSRPIMPGTGINMNCKSLFKMSTPVYPTMDRLFADVYFFYTPNRLVMSRRYGSPDLNDSVYSWAYFIGAQDNLLNMPLPQTGAMLPTVSSAGIGSTRSYRTGSLADYFDYAPCPVPNAYWEYNPFDLLSYFAIWNENFREPSTCAPVTWSISSNHFNFSLATARGNWLYVNSAERTLFGIAGSGDYSWTNPFPSARDTNLMLPLPTSIFHGYFGSMLPWPQRNAAGVELPLGDAAPVFAGSSSHLSEGDRVNPMRLLEVGASNLAVNPVTDRYLTNQTWVNEPGMLGGSTGTTDIDRDVLYAPSNLYADLSSATAANVNALRAAIQKQRWYEKLARSGNRYDELEYGTFGVRPKDSGSDRPVYLGGKRIELAIEMVASTQGGSTSSSSEGSGSLGSLGAFSHTNDSDHYFSSEFDDWGTLSCVFTIRHHTTLGTGTDRHKLKIDRDEYYFPTFAHLGEQSTWYGELVDSDGATTPITTKYTIGFQQAWEEERTDVDRVSGLLRPGKSLAFMTYAEAHSGTFSLAQFLNASRQIAHIDNTLAVSSIASGFQFIYQLTFDYTMRAPIPVYSIPGLMDHF